MAQMTEKKYKELRRQYLKVKSKLEEAMTEQQKAQDAGDLRENEEYATARARTEALTKQKAAIEKLLSEAEIVPEDRSPRITIGSVVDVCKTDASGNPIGQKRRFVVEQTGDTVMKGVLGIKSPLGKVILNGTSGLYKIPDNGGLVYSVKKVLNA